MKKVILNNQQEETISVQDLNDSHIIGVETQSERIKCQVVKFTDEGYTTIAIGDDNNYGSKRTYKTIRELLKSSGLGGVLVFDSKQEFIKWLSEK